LLSSWRATLKIIIGSSGASSAAIYLRLVHREGWDKRETERQLRGALFERAVLVRPKVSPAVTQLRPTAETLFKDSYLVDFLDLPEGHSEQDLQAAITVNLKRFLLTNRRFWATKHGAARPFLATSRTPTSTVRRIPGDAHSAADGPASRADRLAPAVRPGSTRPLLSRFAPPRRRGAARRPRASPAFRGPRSDCAARLSPVAPGPQHTD